MDVEPETVYKSYSLSPEIGYASIAFKTYSFDCSDCSSQKQYKIMNYDKKRINDISEPDVGNYRSVIFSENTSITETPCENRNTKLLCFSPPKSVSFDEFISRHIEFDAETMTLSETVEGTMISLFYNIELRKWEIATKGAVSGNYYFFRTEYMNIAKTQNITFRKMFIDALRYDTNKDAKNVDLGDIPFVAALSTNYCYNFVVQHPENHIVNQVEFPRLVVISVYNIVSDEFRAINIPRVIFENWNCFYNSVVEFPEIYDTFLPKEGIMTARPMTYWSINSLWAGIQCPASCLGVTITHSISGDRSRINNPAYIELRELRGNNANLQYHYLCLLRMKKLDEFLLHFSGYTSIMRRFDTQYRTFAKNIHKCYVSHYVVKNKVPITPKYRTHIYRLHHDVYLPSLNRIRHETLSYNVDTNVHKSYSSTEHVVPINTELTPKYRSQVRLITLREVFTYLISIEPRHLLYSINSDE